MIDDYLTDLNDRLRVSKSDRSRILLEVRDHLDDAVARGRANQVGPDLAAERAIREFGSAALLATEFNAVAGTRAMRRETLVALSAGIVVVVGFLVAVTTQSQSRTANSASMGAQVSFFAAALAFQIAVVAGARAGSRVLAMGRAPTAPAEDRRLVHRCVVTCVGALGIAAAAWATCIGLAAQSLAHPHEATLAVGAASMIGSVVVAVIAMTHLDVNADDESTDARTSGRGTLDLGERTIDLVRCHPVSMCASLAAIAALAAMFHAETSVAAALPRGVLQAAAVVAGFVVLGPTLGLRRRRTA